MRRTLLLAMLLCACSAAPASAQLPGFGPTCGSAGNVLLESAGPTSDNFRVDGSSTASPAVSGADALALMETVRARLVSEFGWPAPPVDPDLGKYYTRFGPANQSGVQTTGTFTEADGEKKTTCIVIPANSNLADLKPFFARELAKAVWFGLGAMTGPSAAPLWLRESAAEAMEDEVFTDDAVDQALPEYDEPLADAPSDALSRWLVLRGLAEPLGTGVPGGVEDVLLGAMAAHAAGATDPLAALGTSLAAKGSALEPAFHEYAIAARFMKPCADPRSFPCFADAASYGAAPASQATHASTADTLEDSVPAGLALKWIDLPAGPYDAELVGDVTGTIACATDAGLRTFPMADGARVRNIDCANPVLVVTSGAATGDDVPFTLEFLPATVVLTVQRFGEGLVGSTDLFVNCGDVCSATYELAAATKVTLGAQALPGHRFAGWAGDCSGTAAVCEVTLDRDRTVAAGFAPVQGAGGPPTGPGSGSSDDVTAPKVLFAKPRFTRSLKKLKAELTCPADEASSCTGPVGMVLRIGKKRYAFDGEAIVRVRPGRSAKVVYELSSSVRRKLRRGKKVRVTVSIRARDEAFNTLERSKTFKKVKVPRAKRK